MFLALLDTRILVKVSDRNIISKLGILGKLFVIKILLSFLFLGIIKFFGVGNNNLVESMLAEFDVTLVLLIIVLVSPLYEELIFRLPLVYNPIYLGSSIFLSFYFIGGKYIFGTGYLTIDSYFLPKLILSIVMGIAVFFFFKKNKNIKVVWKGNFKILYITSIVLFGLAHIRNFDFSWSQFYLVPLLISTHLLAGVILNYIRFRLGFIYCVVFHGFNNLIAFLFNL